MPVLAIRYGIRKRSGAAAHRRAGPSAADVATGARARARPSPTRNGGELHLITVCETADQQREEDHLSDVAGSLPQQLQLKTATIRGTDVEKEVCRYVDRVEADMLFVNSTGEPGPVKRDIIRSAGVPVMIVPAS